MLRSTGIAICLTACFAGSSHGITITLDYSYDASNFFGSGNPAGAAAGAKAKASLEAAAGYLSGILQDSFDSIATPPPFYSSSTGPQFTWQWESFFPNPATGATVSLQDPIIPANEYIVYAGGRSLPDTKLGIGGPGGYYPPSAGGSYYPSDKSEIDAITNAFFDSLATRGEPAGEFTRWGGAITFDTDVSANWHYDHSTPVVTGKNDFYSVAIHELTHALGFGTSDEWNALVSGSTFFGAAAYAANGNSYPAVNGGHWNYSTQSTVYGTSTPQEAAMDPNLTTGSRKLFTALDAAGLADIGWEVQAPVVVLDGDFDGDNDVDGADFLLWQRSGASAADLAKWEANLGMHLAAPIAASVPEPGAVVQAFLAALLCAGSIRRPRR